MTTFELYRKHKSGEVSREKFLYEVRRDNNLPFITNLTSYEDAITILRNKGIVTDETSAIVGIPAIGLMTEGQTKEAKADEAVKAEVKAKAPSNKKPKELNVDQVNPYEYRHGIQYELCELDDYSDEALEKAKDKVLKNLAKDENFYSNLLNAQQSPFTFKQTETDKPGMQAKADGYLKKELKKDEKSNVKDNLGKKEAGKKKPKGVKVMPDKGVTGSEKTIKENLIKEVILKVYNYDPSSGELEDVEVEYFTSEDEAKKAALAHHWQIAFDNDDTELSKDEFVAQTNWEDLQPYENYGYDIVSDKGNIREGLEVKQDNDEIEISADSGDYVGYVEDGKVSFSVMFDDMSDIEDEFGPEGISEDNWKDVLGPNHAFVKIIDAIGGDVEALGDYVQITVDADQLLNSNIREGLEEEIKNSYQTNVELTNAETNRIKKLLPDAEFEWDEDERKQVIYSKKSEDEIQNIVNQVIDSPEWRTKLTKEEKLSKLKTELKTKLKEILTAGDLQQAKRTGKTINIPKDDKTSIQAAEKAKVSFTTYE